MIIRLLSKSILWKRKEGLLSNKRQKGNPPVKIKKSKMPNGLLLRSEKSCVSFTKLTNSLDISTRKDMEQSFPIQISS